MMDLCMSCYHGQTSQQQRKPHHKPENHSPPPPFSACLTVRLSASKSLDVLQHSAAAAARCFTAEQKKPSELQGLLESTSPSLHFGFMAKNLRLYPRDLHLTSPLSQRAVCSCYSSHSLISQVFQLFTMQAHCNWKNLKRNIELVVPSSSAFRSNSVHTLQTS